MSLLRRPRNERMLYGSLDVERRLEEILERLETRPAPRSSGRVASPAPVAPDQSRPAPASIRHAQEARA